MHLPGSGYIELDSSLSNHADHMIITTISPTQPSAAVYQRKWSRDQLYCSRIAVGRSSEAVWRGSPRGLSGQLVRLVTLPALQAEKPPLYMAR